MSSNPDCDNGDKFVLKNKKRVNRRQFLFMDGKTILAFVPNGQKFTQCSNYTEVTKLVKCKVNIQLYLTNYPCPRACFHLKSILNFTGSARSSGHFSPFIL